MENLQNKKWWMYVHNDLRELLTQSRFLIDNLKKWEVDKEQRFQDYAFIVFPAAKAYEGFLKTLFFDMGFMGKDDYYGKRFRIGRSLNPSLEKRFRSNESIYDKLVEYLGGYELADTLWDTWKNCRNMLFHWFPNEKNAISFAEAENRVMDVVNAMDKAYEECKIKGKR